MEKVGHKMENSSDFIKNFPFYMSDFSNGKIIILKLTDTKLCALVHTYKIILFINSIIAYQISFFDIYPYVKNISI